MRDDPAAPIQPPSRETTRGNLRNLLRCLGSEPEQRAYQQRVGWVHVPTELACQWFDDLYYPEAPDWTCHFSPEELDAFERFDSVFEETLQRVSMEIDLDSLLSTEGWQRMMAEARRALATLEAQA